MGWRKFAIEVDGKIGHTSKRSHEKREAKKEYLKTQGITLFGFATKWVVGKEMLADSLFYEELGLPAITPKISTCGILVLTLEPLPPKYPQEKTVYNMWQNLCQTPTHRYPQWAKQISCSIDCQAY